MNDTAAPAQRFALITGASSRIGASLAREFVRRGCGVARVVADLATLGRVPDIVVANAGFGVVGKALKLTIEDYRRQFETNVFGVLRTLHETADCLRARAGRFVIMGSVSGHLSGAGSSAYTMSKFSVRALAEALHGELNSLGVAWAAKRGQIYFPQKGDRSIFRSGDEHVRRKNGSKNRSVPFLRKIDLSPFRVSPQSLVQIQVRMSGSNAPPCASE